MGRIREHRRWRCDNCAVVTLEPDLLTAPSPFDPDATLTGCPACKYDGDFTLLCDEPGCMLAGSCGWPTGDNNDIWSGYRNTCFAHSEWSRR